MLSQGLSPAACRRRGLSPSPSPTTLAWYTPPPARPARPVSPYPRGIPMVLTKQELIGSLQHEVRILVHLASKVKPEMIDYRPTTKQRTTIELLRYLTVMGPALIKATQVGA